MENVLDLKQTFPNSGRVDWIGIATERLGDISVLHSVHVEVGTGIQGEHHANSSRSKRQVTLFQAEYLPVLALLIQQERVDPRVLRRNIVVSGINLNALKTLPFRIGDAVLCGSGPCPPCSRMEANLGTGGYAAMLGHGGITATVQTAGEIRVGDRVVFDATLSASAER